ncbi:MAG TPA: hypothetical protein VGN97_23850, partial [Mesorhizobium sp.]|nr:hypothetical protein [Mesorhizobium sp.]
MALAFRNTDCVARGHAPVGGLARELSRGLHGACAVGLACCHTLGKNTGPAGPRASLAGLDLG